MGARIRIDGDEGAGLAVVTRERAELAVGVVAAEGEEGGFARGGGEEGAELGLGLGLSFLASLIRKGGGRRGSSSKESPDVRPAREPLLGADVYPPQRTGRKKEKVQKKTSQTHNDTPLDALKIQKAIPPLRPTPRNRTTNRIAHLITPARPPKNPIGLRLLLDLGAPDGVVRGMPARPQALDGACGEEGGRKLDCCVGRGKVSEG